VDDATPRTDGRPDGVHADVHRQRTTTDLRKFVVVVVVVVVVAEEEEQRELKGRNVWTRF
jgi:hypothetical protein